MKRVLHILKKTTLALCAILIYLIVYWIGLFIIDLLQR